MESPISFRGQLKTQLEQLRCGNANVDGTIEFIMDLIGNTKISDVDAAMAEEVRRLRLENGHLQYFSKRVDEAPAASERLTQGTER